MKQISLVLFFILAATQVLAQAAYQYRRDCTGGFVAANNMQPSNSPEAVKVLNRTGIRIMELKAPATTLSGDYTITPQQSETAKNNFAKKVANFLTTFPIDFLKRNNDICFLLISQVRSSVRSHMGVAVGHILLLPTDSTLDTITHEMFHAIEYVTDFNENFWAALNANGRCAYGRTTSLAVARHSLSTLDSCFVSSYSQRNTAEDRAEIFAAMIQDYHNLARKTPDNSALQSKIRGLQEYLATFDGEMNLTYWANRPSFGDNGLYNSCGSSAETDPACRFEESEPVNASWSLQ